MPCKFTLNFKYILSDYHEEKLVQSRKLVKEILKGIEKESPDFFRCLVGFMVFESPLVLLRFTTQLHTTNHT